MSVKIRVSYTDDEELAGVIRLLSPAVKSWKVAKRQESTYRNAYIYLHPFGRTNEEGKGCSSRISREQEKERQKRALPFATLLEARAKPGGSKE